MIFLKLEDWNINRLVEDNLGYLNYMLILNDVVD